MSQTTIQPAKPSVPDPALQTEPKFWSRYSPHHELPLSTVTSIAVHALALCLVLLAASAIWKAQKPELPDNRYVEVAGLGTGTGPNGGGSEAGTGATEKQPEENVPTPQDPVEGPKPDDTKLTTPTKAPETAIVIADTPGTTVEPGTVGKKLEGIQSAARERLDKMLGRGKGTDTGTGSSSGPGTGDGPPGVGDNNTPGGKIRSRAARQRRWNIVFNARTGRQYLDQLHAAGAILAVPRGDNEKGFLVFHDLKDPKGQFEDISKFTQLYWVDDQRDSIEKLAGVLHVHPIPPFIASFMPEKFEKELLDLEKRFLKENHPRAREEDIQRTEFRFVPRPDRTGYKLQVVGQTLNPPEQ